ncbi:MAG: hypothetical protein ACAH12_10420 [Methylophilaceae bacterium]
MKITPRHFAAAQYTVIAFFTLATWYTMLTPWERAVGQIEFMFAPGYEYRKFFVWLAITNLLTVFIAIAFWSKRSTSHPLALILALLSVGLFIWAIWQSNNTFIFNYGLGCLLAIFSWLRPNPSFKRDA